jgi:type VI protein secretion system component Hcp
MSDASMTAFYASGAAPLAIVLGTNEIASAIAVRLMKSGHAVVMSHDPFPPVIRRAMSFHDALFGDRARVEGVNAERAETLIEIADVVTRGDRVAVTPLHLTDLLAFRRPRVLVDARMQKHRVTPDYRGLAQVTVGVGPNFVVDANCDVAVETRPIKTGAFDYSATSGSSSSAADGASPTTFYLTIAGLNGGSANAKHKGAFEISDYKFDVAQLASVVGSGGGAGKTTFDPLVVDLNLGSGLTTLLQDIAAGKHISSLRLEGVNSTGQTVYDLRLADLTIGSLIDNGKGFDQIAFDYSKVSVTTQAQKADGTLTGPATFGWDLAANKSTGQLAAAAAAATAVDGSGSGAKFYLTIDGLNGSSIDAKHKGAFEITDFKFDLAQLASVVGSGGGGGETTFDPLVVDLNLGSGLTKLLQDVAAGKHVSSLRLEGVNNAGQTIYDLRMADVTVGSPTDRGPGVDQIAFDYSKVSVTTLGQKADGTLTTPATFGWDVKSNKAFQVALPPAASGQELSSAPANVSIDVQAPCRPT